MIRRYWWVMIAMIPVGVIAGHLAAGVITLKMPKLFESVGVIEVMPPPQGDSTGTRMKPRQFSQMELGRIADGEILERVTDGLDLPGLWEMDRDAALRKLKESVRCELDQESNRISVKVRCRAKVDARDIARSVIVCYWERALKPSDPVQAEALKELNRQIDEQNERTTKSRDAISRGKANFGATSMVRGEAEFEANVRALQELEKKLDDLGKSIQPHLPVINAHQSPEIPQSVASPDIEKNLLVGKGVGLLLTPLLAWPVIVMMNRRRPEGGGPSVVTPVPEKPAFPEDEW